MQSNRIYLIRRNILTALKDCHPAPASLSDIQAHPRIQLYNAAPDEINTELENLVLGEYVRNVKGFNGAIKVITFKGLRQINQEAERDPFIWGVYGAEEQE